MIVQVDVGSGDAVTPDAVDCEFPAMLAHRALRIRAYPQETAVAEKLHAICSIGLANSRMKDFYDLVIMSRIFPFAGETLVEAVRATFTRRGSTIPNGQPIGLSDEFATNREKQA